MHTVPRTKWRLAVPLIPTFLASAQGFLSIPYNTGQYFGPDGPWQAVSLGIYPPGNKDVNAQRIDVMPARLADTLASFYLPTTQACANDKTGDCGAGGMLRPYNTNTSTWYWLDNSQTGYYFILNGSSTVRDIALPKALSTWNSTVVASRIAEITYPNGVTVGMETGFVCLGGSPVLESYSEPKSLYDSSLTQSDSFGLHIGSAALNYPGSLIFGGYDRGRVIGPVITYNAEGVNGDVQVIDIVISVETGESPFDFDYEDGLLVSSSDTEVTSPVAALLKPEYPYIFLPQATLTAITSKLPINFDSKSGYYLWDTKDPSYLEIINSPAYLGFIFPSNTGDTANNTIKVPFKLLNLTLERSISGLDSDVAYFPVMQNEYDGRHVSGYEALLGRAFLQAAFMGTNWGRNTSWLAQAPGPGQSMQGLGYDPTDLYSSDTSLNVQTGDTLFKDSWKGHWTPLPGTSAQKNNTVTDNTSPGGLSGGAIAGIIVGVIGGIAIIAAIGAFFIIRRRKQRRSKVAELGGDTSAYPYTDKPSQGSAAAAGGELDGDAVGELDGHQPDKAYKPYPDEPSEMPTPHERYEMAAPERPGELP